MCRGNLRGCPRGRRATATGRLPVNPFARGRAHTIHELAGRQPLPALKLKLEKFQDGPASAHDA